MNSISKSMLGTVTVLILLIFHFKVHAQDTASNEIRSVAWSPDGTQIAVGQGSYICNTDDPNEHEIQILDAISLQMTQELVFHTCTVTSLDWSSDGKRLVSTGGVDGTAIVWDISSGKPISISQSFSMPGRYMDIWSPDDSEIAGIAAASSKIVIWNPENGETLNTFEHTGSPYAIAWSPDGGELVTANGSGKVEIWSSSSGELISELEGHVDIVSSVVWSPDGQTIISGGWDNMIYIWDVQSGSVRHVLKGHSAIVEKLALSPDGSELASASDDATVRIWDINSGEEEQIFTYSGPVYTVTWNPDGSEIAFGGLPSDNESIQIVSLSDPQTITPTPQAEN